MIRLTRRFTLFPYPPLFRSRFSRRSRLESAAARTRAAFAVRTTVDAIPRASMGEMAGAGDTRDQDRCAAIGKRRTSRRERSEEHTSELQSRQYLVCRLLLEK